MADLEKTLKGLEYCHDLRGIDLCRYCPYDGDISKYHCQSKLMTDALELLMEENSLQEFLMDIESSNSILNSVNNHCISLEHASQIIAICACACDLISPSGFIGWLKDRIAQDAILKGVLGNDKSRNH